MPDPVEGFTDITKYSSNFFPFIQGLSEGVLNIYELIYPDWRAIIIWL